MILGLNPHSFVNLPAEEQEKLLKEYGSQKAAEKALEEKYGEMARHPIVKMSKSLATSSTPTRWWTSTVPTPCVCMRCSWVTLSRPHPADLCHCRLQPLPRPRVGAVRQAGGGRGYRPAIETLMHQTIKKVGADIESLKMNTAIAQLMTLVNALYDNGGATKAELETVVQLLNRLLPT